MRTVRVRDVVLGEGRPAIIVPVAAPDIPAVRRRLGELDGHACDVVEWRVDRLDTAGDPAAVLAAARALLAASPHRPVLATVRTVAEGGEADLDEDRYDTVVRSLVAAGPDLVDVELSRPGAATLTRAAHEAGVPVVMSAHDFAGTPPAPDLVALLRRMQDLGADVTKIAVTPRDAGDVLTLLTAAWEMRSRWADRPFIAIAMGATGVVSRLAGGVFGSCATFAAVGEASAPGQVDADRLAEVLDLVHRAR